MNEWMDNWMNGWINELFDQSDESEVFRMTFNQLEDTRKDSHGQLRRSSNTRPVGWLVGLDGIYLKKEKSHEFYIHRWSRLLKHSSGYCLIDSKTIFIFGTIIQTAPNLD